MSCAKPPLPSPCRRPHADPARSQRRANRLESVTEISRQYSERLSSRFSQLWRNITGSPHKPFHADAFRNAAGDFLLLAGLVFAFWWLVRLAALPLYRKMGHWGRHKTVSAITGFSYRQPLLARLSSTCCCWR